MEKARDWSQQYKIILELFLRSQLAIEYGPNKLGLARCLGASQGKTQKWEKGQWPSASDLAVMAERLGCSYRWLVTGEGEPLEHDTPLPVPKSPGGNDDAEEYIRDLEQRLAIAREELNTANRMIIDLQEELLVMHRTLFNERAFAAGGPPVRGTSTAVRTTQSDNEERKPRT